ncbi:MAG: hemerythrin domain-containing protein [Candidatus Aureabacteria bacterium]|nr:hemerythrin domain-containing protein [Candidatus Auribacterota bacterium]
MKPRGPLMIEHRLIEKMIDIIKKEMDDIKRSKQADSAFIDIAVDFIRIYADRTHHGKEEDILFRSLSLKDMSAEDKKVMNELIEEHQYGRKTVKALVEAKEKYVQGDTRALGVISDKLKALVDFYPRHIKKEDDVFFPNSERYFSDDELNKMLSEFWEFDRNMIHEKYRSLVDSLRG